MGLAGPEGAGQAVQAEHKAKQVAGVRVGPGRQIKTQGRVLVGIELRKGQRSPESPEPHTCLLKGRQLVRKCISLPTKKKNVGEGEGQ